MRIGIDTGGTYTDAVLFDDDGLDGPGPASGGGRVVATAKARTRTDLSVGIAEALDRVLAEPALTGPDQVSLVSLSTTLATNALVEGVGGRAALVFIGFGEAELDRGGLRRALGDAPVLLAAGGHDSMGVERAPFDADDLARRAAELDVDAFAVAAQFSVRNPAHELAARRALADLGKPVACGHELSARLDGPRRALTCLLNARLIGLVAELCQAAERILAERGIEAPLMIVKGDGSLVAAELARQRPIETILSGPAASLIGAGWLTGLADAVVSDLGGTTTDVGLLRSGRPTVSGEGATVGGHRTMVEAVELFTFGLGGDSEVTLDLRRRPAAVVIGPRRVTPLAVLAADEADLVHRTLGARQFPFRPHDLLFARATGRAGSTHQREARVLTALGERWRPLDEVAATNLEASAVRTLVSRGLVELAGFTPTDAAHVLGLHTAWDREAARAAAGLLAAAPDSGGDPVMPGPEELARWVLDTLVRRSGEAVLTATLAADGLPASTVDSPLVALALDRPGGPGATTVALGSAAPLVGIGAPAATYHPLVADLLGGTAVVPHHAEVANAVGAAIGGVRVTRQITVSQPTRGQFRIHHPAAGPDLGDLEPAIDRAVELAGDQAAADAARAGAAGITVQTDVVRRTARVGGRELLVEATVTAVAAGPPKPR